MIVFISPPDVVSTGSETIKNVIRRCFERSRGSGKMDENLSRWQRLLETNDAKLIWAAVNWKGNIDMSENLRRDDEQFPQHFEELLNPGQARDVVQSVDLDSAPSIPVLDDLFTPRELTTVITNMNKNKSYVGIWPGLFSALPSSWFMFLLSVSSI